MSFSIIPYNTIVLSVPKATTVIQPPNALSAPTLPYP